MKHLSVLIKPASSLCNIRCKYCFYANISSMREVESYGVMQPAVMKKMIDQIFIDLDNGDHMTFGFQGGEPTLAGLRYFRQFVEYVSSQPKKVQVHYAIQTNGTMLNDEWISFLEENNFLVGLSIDGCPKFHNTYRVDIANQGTYSKVLEAKNLLENSKVEYNILSVLTSDMAKEPDLIFDFLINENIGHIQFIPCLDDLDATEKSNYALEPKFFAHFYKNIFERWQKELNKGNYISIQLIDSVVNLLSGSGMGFCGQLGRCSVQFVIEADGSVYPCDFYVLDEYRMGYITESTLFDLRETRAVEDFICSRPEIAEYCQSCPFLKICNGGCKRMENAMYLNEEGTYCGYQDFLNSQWENIKQVIARL